MRLLDLMPQFITRKDDTSFEDCLPLHNADGIIFVCPKCLRENGGVRAGVHSIICWQPRVPQTTSPTPGRWTFHGTGYDDLTLVAGSSSIALSGGCNAHFFVRNGEVIDA